MSAVQKRTAAGGGKIVFESGVYCFDSSAAVRMDFHVSNHDQPPLRAVQLPFVGVRHVVLEGRDTVFRFSGETMGLLLMDTEDVTIRGIRVFVPASQSGMPKDSDLSQMLKQKGELRVTEVNRARRRVVGVRNQVPGRNAHGRGNEGRIVGIENGRTRVHVESGKGDLYVRSGRLF